MVGCCIRTVTSMLWIVGFVMACMLATACGQGNVPDYDAFWTEDEDMCVDPMQSGGDCHGDEMERWYYDGGVCKPFTFRCNANLNNFLSQDMCEWFCDDDRKHPRSLDVTLAVSHDAPMDDRPLLLSDRFRRDVRIRMALFAEVEPEYVRQVNAIPVRFSGQTGGEMRIAFRIAKDARIEAHVAAQVFNAKMDNGDVRWRYRDITMTAIDGTRTLAYTTAEVQVVYKNMIISFAAIALIFSMVSCISVICMCTMLNTTRKNAREAIENELDRKIDLA